MLKPLLKWVGGKSQCIDEILSIFPSRINTYHEPFVGGGSVLLALLQSPIHSVERFIAYDANQALIGFYQDLQASPQELYDSIAEELKKNGTTKDDYYRLRAEYNTSPFSSLRKSTLFFLLNKLGFRGMYRVSKKNHFNIPYGNYKNPSILPSLDVWMQTAILLSPVEFKHQSITYFDSSFDENDFIYFDPPYVPETKTASFVGYTSDGFTLEDHHALFEMILELQKKTIRWCLSNSDTSLVRDTFRNVPGIVINEVECRRRINAKKPGQTTKELCIFNKIP